MINTQNINIKISYRSKFEKLLTDANRQAIDRGFKKFIFMNPHDATMLLWEMTYKGVDSSSEVLGKLGIQIGEDFPSANLLQLRNELRYQYERRYEDFMSDENLPAECQAAFFILYGRTDIITTTVVYEHCQRLRTEDEVSRTLFLLKDEKENCYNGGIRSLGFSQAETNYLKPYHEQIFELFKACCDYLQQQDEMLMQCCHLVAQDEENGVEPRDEVLYAEFCGGK